jgi:hypothetical protein
MKTMIKQRGFFAVLTVALLITVALVTTCGEPSMGNLTQRGNDDDIRAPEGKGILKLRFVDGNRTIIPDITLGTYFFTGSVSGDWDGTPNNKPLFTDYTPHADLSSATPMVIDKEEEYTITIDAFIFTGDISVPADVANPALYFPVLAGTATVELAATDDSDTVMVTLSPITYSTTETGTFEWDITVTGIISADATLSLKEYVGGTNAFTVDLTDPGANEDSRSVAPGFYIAEVVVELEDYYTRTISRVVHIYANLTSSLTGITVADPTVTNVYAVTHNVSGNSNADTYTPDRGTRGIHGYNILEPTNEPTHSNTTLSFNSWHRNATWTSAWNFGSDIITGPLTLYALFVGTSGSFTIDVEVSSMADEQLEFPTTAPSSIAVGPRGADNQIAYNGNITTFTIPNLADIAGYDEIVWKINKDVVTNTTVSNAPGPEAPDYNPYFPETFILVNNSTNAKYLLPGTTIEVTVEALKGGARYGAEVDVAITISP